MKFRAGLAFVCVAAISACTSDNPTGLSNPIADPAFAAGVKPPPPLGTEDTYIEIDAQVAEDFSTSADAAVSMETIADPFFNARLLGRTFYNTQGNNAWIAFEEVIGGTASQNARLAYNQDQNKTNGHGILTDADGTVLNLALVTILPTSVFNPCPDADDGYALCAVINFIYNNDPSLGGTIRVSNSAPPPVLVLGDRLGSN
jgi:hypothetical protein